jgi:hypothetical protein
MGLEMRYHAIAADSEVIVLARADQGNQKRLAGLLSGWARQTKGIGSSRAARR